MIASEYEQKLFAIHPDDPMLLLEGVTYGIDNQAIEYFKAIYRGDRFKFSLQSQRNGYETISNPAIIAGMSGGGKDLGQSK